MPSMTGPRTCPTPPASDPAPRGPVALHTVARDRGRRARAGGRGRTLAGALSIALAAAGIVGSSAALAAPGDLVPRGCIEDGGGAEGCGRYAEGLAGAGAIVVSPDGRSVYVTAFDDDAVVHLRRNRRHGGLRDAGCIDDEGSAACARGIEGLDGASDVAISANGRHVYVTSYGDSSLLHFLRNRRTGRLRLANCIDDADLAPVDDVCPGGAEGLSGALDVALSPDGRSLYVASQLDAAIVRFALDRAGRPRAVDCYEDDDKLFSDDCARDREGLASASAVTVSPDGRSVYVASFADDAVTRFVRKRNGALRYRGCVDDNEPPDGPDECARSTDGLNSAHSLVVSPDGRYLYAGTSNDLTIVRFRLARRGELRPRGCVEHPSASPVCATVANGIGRAGDFAIDDRGRSLYVAGLSGMAPFKRLPGSGDLIERPCLEDVDRAPGPSTCPRKVRGLGGVNAVALSPDERWLYAASSTDAAVATFKRRR